MNDINISVAALLWFIGAVTALISFSKLVHKPFDEIRDHEQRIKRLEDDSREKRKTDKLILRSLNALVNHSIDGNGIEGLKDVRDDLQNSIIDSK